MEKQENIKPETTTDEFTDKLKQLEACQKAIAWCTEHSGLSVDQLLDDFQTDEEAEASWASWALRVLGDKISLDIRKKFIAKITNPMEACQLYVRLSWLTEEEDKLLYVKFQGKLPTAEKELATGIVVREKK